MDKKGFTFFEILLATFILSVIMVGLTSVFISAKKLIRHNKSRVTASEVARRFMDPFQLMVRNDTWGQPDNVLSNMTSYNSTVGAPYLDNNYTAIYTFTYGNLTGLASNMTRVKAVINWTEPDVP